jgi:hypothetical protein
MADRQKATGLPAYGNPGTASPRVDEAGTRLERDQSRTARDNGTMEMER